MVSNYFQDCKYLVNKLQPYVYLISENALKDIRIDNGDAYVNSISETPTRLDVYNISLTEGDELNERFKFTHTLTFSVNGYANKDDFNGKYYVILKDDEGTYWLINPMLPCKVTYTYTLAYEENHTDFNIGTVSNHPVLRLLGMSDSQPYECKKYFISGIDALWLNEKRYTAHDGNAVKYTNGGFKTIEYNKKSAVFTEEFDGTKVSHTIDFNVLFSDYKSSWHYNLLEFKDNLYAGVIKTTDGKYALCGFGYGLQPSFTINANDNETINYVEIKLTDSHDVGDMVYFHDNVTYEYLSGKTWEYTSEHNGYECVSEGVAKYLLQKEVDALGNETDKFKCLDGYEGEFADLDIVGVFYDDVEFSSVNCASIECMINTSMPSTIRFDKVGCKTFYMEADTDWSITSSSSGVTVTPNSGQGHWAYDIDVCNTIQPSTSQATVELTVNYCERSETKNVVIMQSDSCLTQGNEYSVNSSEQTLTIPTKCCVESVTSISTNTAATNVYSNYIQVYIPRNNGDSVRDFVLFITYCDGHTNNIIITQGSTIEKWVTLPITEDYWCDDCGYVPPAPEQHRTISGSAYCTGVDKYVDVYSQVSYDSGETWETTATTKTLLEHNSEDCGYGERWRDIPISQDYWCDDCSYLEKWVVIPINEDYWCDECQ